MPAKKKASPRIPAKPKNVKPYGLTDFFMKKKAEDGITVPISLPSGEDSGHTLRIRGIDSDTFKKAQSVRSRENLRILALPDVQQEEETEKADTVLLASLVAEWSFQEELTEANVITLLTENPLIRALVDSTAAKRKDFFGKR